MSRAVWPEGAYLEAGSLWLCLSLDAQVRTGPHPDYTHIAFSVAEDDFPSLSIRLMNECRLWKADGSEGESVYFLDPDGHKLEMHVGSLRTRLQSYRANASKGIEIIER